MPKIIRLLEKLAAFLGKPFTWIVRLNGRAKRVAAILMVIVTFLAAFTASIRGISWLWVSLTNFGTESVEIVDIRFTGNEALDIKLTNTGEDTVFFKEANLRVKKRWTLVPPYYYNPDPRDCEQVASVYAASSHKYEMLISAQNNPPSIALSQVIESNNVDRFTISLNPEIEETSLEADYVYLAALSLTRDSDDKVLFSQDLLFTYRFDTGQTSTARSYQPGDCWLVGNNAAQLKAENKKAISQIQHIQARRDPDLGQLSQRIQ